MFNKSISMSLQLVLFWRKIVVCLALYVCVLLHCWSHFLCMLADDILFKSLVSLAKWEELVLMSVCKLPVSLGSIAGGFELILVQLSDK